MYNRQLVLSNVLHEFKWILCEFLKKKCHSEKLVSDNMEESSSALASNFFNFFLAFFFPQEKLKRNAFFCVSLSFSQKSGVQLEINFVT